MFQAKESAEVRLSVQAGGPRCEPKVSDEPEKQSSWECKLAGGAGLCAHTADGAPCDLAVLTV